MSSLQIGLIIAGILLVIGVIVYNRWQERRLTRDLHTARTPAAAPAPVTSARAPDRVEPTLGTDDAPFNSEQRSSDHAPAFRAGRVAAGAVETSDVVEDTAVTLVTSPLAPARTAAASGARPGDEPDHEIECIIRLQPESPVPAGAVGAGLHARVGKALRWFGREDARSDWQRLSSDTPGRYSDVIACMLLADRNGAASHAQIESFTRIVADIAPTLPAAFSPPDIERETARAESLDRLCADLDVQIGITLQKPDPGSIAGTRLRGVAEASGFRLASGGRFELIQEDTGVVQYTVQNLRPDPFTTESLRLTATNGVVFVLDVARLAEPARVFDQMKLAAKRMAVTLGAELVDDNRRVLDDAAFASIREQVGEAAEALRAVHIEPGSARALALFSA